MTTRPAPLYLAACSLLPLLSSGCVWATHTTDLTYPPQRKVRVNRPAEASVHEAPLIALGVVRDERTTGAPRRVGELRNALGWRTADLHASTDVTAWVRDALRYELTRTGYEVIDGPSLDGLLDIDAALVSAFTIGDNAYDGEVILAVQFARPGREPVRTRYFGRGTTGLEAGAEKGLEKGSPGSAGEQSLALALSDALRELLADVKRLVPRRAAVQPAPGAAPRLTDTTRR